jgi:hypothetical protein
MRKTALALVILISVAALAIGNLPPAADADTHAEQLAALRAESHRQGGETLSEATGIWSLPFGASGTTAGYQDDYDAACPYSSDSPDVVYSFFSQEPNVALTIDLCDSNYDTKVYVYTEDTLVVACSDDTCGVPPHYNRSRIENLWLTDYHYYYIVVDGGNGESGDYDLTVELALGACCTTLGGCALATEPACLASGRIWMGAGTVCDPNPCIPTPVKQSNWGEIKGHYR